MRNPISILRNFSRRIVDAIDGGPSRLVEIESRLASQSAQMRAIVEGASSQLAEMRKAQLDLGMDFLVQTNPRYRDARRVGSAPGQVYSQNNEDGVIAEIFRRIGTTAKTFIEIAAGDGVENTTRLLLDLGWSGIWIEAGDAQAASIRTLMSEPIADGRLVFIQNRVDRENVVELLQQSLPSELDYLSLDIDYNTSHIWSALTALRPRVVCVEYNAHFPPSIDHEVLYDPEAMWQGTTRFGASLKALERIGREAGYSLVGCDIFGVNAYFVRNDLCNEERFLAPFTAENHYEPPRYSAVHMRGHGRQAEF
ncbi:hypothetical protein [Rhizobium sp. BK251]|uniref:hypothetical protein n=1 Tax=Rhizobium sp. BK251 TaxID=2512125 RepID=UPI0010441D17|nr:hypothetical protein [Rhizobium sp. BK251]TCL70409.1 hypothetical protein EV286_107280 [Rhizobium sp. BK251]